MSLPSNLLQILLKLYHDRCPLSQNQKDVDESENASEELELNAKSFSLKLFAAPAVLAPSVR